MGCTIPSWHQVNDKPYITNITLNWRASSTTCLAWRAELATRSDCSMWKTVNSHNRIGQPHCTKWSNWCVLPLPSKSEICLEKRAQCHSPICSLQFSKLHHRRIWRKINAFQLNKQRITSQLGRLYQLTHLVLSRPNNSANCQASIRV